MEHSRLEHQIVLEQASKQIGTENCTTYGILQKFNFSAVACQLKETAERLANPGRR